MKTDKPIPILLQVRMQSERCPRKIVREFYQGKSLLEIAAEKFRGDRDVYIAGYEDAFRQTAEAYELQFIRRSEASAMGETVASVLSYIEALDADYACLLNVCSPLLRAQTVRGAIECFLREPCQTLLPAIETHDLFVYDDQTPVNRDAHIFNSKLRKPLYQIANGLLIFNCREVLEHGRYFESYKAGDPYIFPIPYLETLDIDTEEQFAFMQAFFAQQMKNR